MYRPATSFLTALLAIMFAFGALISVRWPSLIMAGGWVGAGEMTEGLSGVDWRQLGVTYGGPYFLAALCFHFSALATYNRRHGAFTWFLFACVSGFPAAFFIDFEPGWWQAPSLGELGALNAAALSILLAWAIWDLRQRKPIPEPTELDTFEASEIDGDIDVQNAETPEPAPVRSARRRGPVPAAIARQRAMFAAQGRKQMARQRKHYRW